MNSDEAGRTVLIRLAYDGTDFAGYQIQRKGRTVQGVLEAALERLHGHPVRTVCAGRTDAGVHAQGQHVSFESDHRGVPAESFAPALNSLLPPDLSVLSSRLVPGGFHAQYDARGRHYRYYLYAAPAILPHRRRYAWRIPEMPDLERLNRDAAELVGTHDFRTFATIGDEHRTTVREIRYARFFIEGDSLVFAVGATGFLRRMVRSLVGTLIERERLRLRGELVNSTMGELLTSRERSGAGTTAPPWGLYLHHVDYEI
jgi:tRNA pseudouridine38-40 synthase